MSYASDSMNGKRNGKGVAGLLGEITTEYMGSQLGNAWTAAAFKVLRSRMTAAATQPAPAPAPTPNVITTTRRVIGGIAPVSRPLPEVNVVTLPNGTAVPSTNGANPVVPPVSSPQPQYYPTVTQGAGGFGPPPPEGGFGVEVGTLEPEEGGSVAYQTAGTTSLAGLTGNSALLAVIAGLAFFMLDGKPKRRRR